MEIPFGSDYDLLNPKKRELINDCLVLPNNQTLALLSKIKTEAGNNELRRIFGFDEGDSVVYNDLVFRLPIRHFYTQHFRFARK